ncbi:unnamed protein product [Camellia sinensis]
MKIEKTVGRRTLEGDGRDKCMPLGEEKIFDLSFRIMSISSFKEDVRNAWFLLKWSLPSSIMKSGQG